MTLRMRVQGVKLYLKPGDKVFRNGIGQWFVKFAGVSCVKGVLHSSEGVAKEVYLHAGYDPAGGPLPIPVSDLARIWPDDYPESERRG